MPKRRTRGISSKVISPFAVALSAFAVAKIHDPAAQSLAVATIGLVAAILAPADEITEAFDADEPAIDTRVVPDPPDA